MDLLQDRLDITDLVKSVASEQGLDSCVITDVKINGKGEGYMGEIFMITVTDPGGENKLQMVVKAAFTNDTVRSLNTVTERFYANEGYFYTTIYPAFKNLEKSRKITHQKDLVPKCFKVCMDYRHEMLCFENLVVDGFELVGKKDVLDDDHFRLIFETYGRLHAYSFALKDQRSEEYDRIAKGACNIFYENMNDETMDFIGNTIGFTKLAGKSLTPGEDDEIIKKFEKYTLDEVGDIYRYVLTDVDDYCAIIHGDSWSNNMMFKYQSNENGKKLCDMRLLDLQIVRVGSPVCDLSYCLYTGGDENSFNNLENYLEVYYESFSSLLEKLGSDPKKLLPFSILEQHWKKYSKFGLLLSTSVLKIKFTEKEDVKVFSGDFENTSEFVEAVIASKFDEKLYQKRMKDILHHMYKLDAL